ncbi:MAG: DUF2997 domain-containing protein [Myxococcales bacterium]|nr:DUF2997 domain-containing protein [Myxococcales bacterium]MCB9731480.1 DUF2997 domain-containing protein [Deltaproteobacteria bacterium]
MKRRDIVITINEDGGVDIKVEGVPGADCIDFTKFLEEELGDVTHREHTSEYFQQEEEESVDIQVGKG